VLLFSPALAIYGDKLTAFGSVTHTYYYDGIKLISEEWSNNTIVFLYDSSGSPIGMQYRSSSKPAGDWDTYYYEKNLQGDIVAVYSATGTKLVTVGII